MGGDIGHGSPERHDIARYPGAMLAAGISIPLQLEGSGLGLALRIALALQLES